MDTFGPFGSKTRGNCLTKRIAAVVQPITCAIDITWSTKGPALQLPTHHEPLGGRIYLSEWRSEFQQPSLGSSRVTTLQTACCETHFQLFHRYITYIQIGCDGWTSSGDGIFEQPLDWNRPGGHALSKEVVDLSHQAVGLTTQQSKHQEFVRSFSGSHIHAISFQEVQCLRMLVLYRLGHIDDVELSIMIKPRW